ncbi:bifunctional diguanylate cyclase/phosphodiesterase [Rhodoferax sp.]|uniref:putative bifunctional diguanylate cyclase/phosphodiesterase n=1 Tax=Rhodoferax sp. TaxID=50421 RepID=UPI0027160EB1|nr:EAL domain-containing protein [Rhodoferax sp.]MDO9197693.1 EAL domain-containing protein [Rhodoferax sp.]
MFTQETALTAFQSNPLIHLPYANSTKSGFARNAYLKFKDLQGATSVRQLHQVLAPVADTMLCCDVLNLFLEDETLSAIPVVDGIGVPRALIERHAYIEYFSRLYSIELFGKKRLEQLGELAAGINKQPIVVDSATSIDDVAAIIIDAGMQHMVSGFIVTEGEKYLGVGNGHGLLNHITQRKQAELYYLAHYDQLTRLPNRMLMNDRLQMACRDSDRSNTLVGLMFVDLDRFKQINDTMGHSFGDILLQAVAERLESCIRGNDTVARLGGDEFAVLLQKLEQPGDADTTAQRIVESFRMPFSILDREVFVTASLGVAIYPRDEPDSCNLLAKADAAMYEAKTSGRNAFRVYRPGLSMHSMDHLSLEADLRHAINREELVLYYQPQVNVASGTLIGVEALVRWQHPQRGLLSPAAFIGIAEDSGMIIDIGNWVLREACRQQRAWSLGQIPPLRMAINISAVQFRRDDFTDIVRTIIEETEVDPGYIELELTENVAMHHADAVLNTLRELKRIGVKLAIDDFGTGFSNLSYLQRFPFDRLKIDQSFVRGIENMPANKSIVQAIVSLARSLSLEVVAEGVETAAEYAQTSACACDEIQGYFHARPMPAADMLTWWSAPK